MGELGCAYCHRDLHLQSTLRDITPDLSSAGLRYNPAYLFEYLQKPSRIRQHLGKARMPDFRFSEKETLALVAFLETQRSISGSWPAALPPRVSIPRPGVPGPLSPSELLLVQSQMPVCLGCHTLEGKGASRAVDLSNISPRLRPAWVGQFLISPQMFGVAATNMPPLFYHLAEDHKHFEPNFGDAAEKLSLITEYLFSLNRGRMQSLEARYSAAKSGLADATAALGEAIFRSQNCAACHRHQSILPREDAAPELASEAGRVQQTWLNSYLRQPMAIRPFGFHPGDGSRMPDFHLKPEEIQQITTDLWKLGSKPASGPDTFKPQHLSAFSLKKAKTLLTDKLACLGCHSLGGQGGKVGPDLGLARDRLQPSYVRSMITNPKAANPHTIMPRLPLPDATINLIANFLLQQDAPVATSSYLSLTENPLLQLSQFASTPPVNVPVREQYLSRCAVCHGSDGQGAGFNARFLPQAPTAHGDAAYISTRPDDTLFDGIAAGGAILNKSHFMPSWGETLSATEIKALVAYIRSLCQCQGPAWSRDNLPAK